MPPTFLSGDDILDLKAELSEALGEGGAITDENRDGVVAVYQQYLAGRVFKPSGQPKALRLEVLGPIIRHLELEVPVGRLPKEFLEACYFWFGEIYGLGEGENGSESPLSADAQADRDAEAAEASDEEYDDNEESKPVSRDPRRRSRSRKRDVSAGQESTSAGDISVELLTKLVKEALEKVPDVKAEEKKPRRRKSSAKAATSAVDVNSFFDEVAKESGMTNAADVSPTVNVDSCGHPPLLCSFEARQRRTAQLALGTLTLDEDDSGRKASFAKSQRLNLSVTRDFVTLELLDRRYRSVLRYVRDYPCKDARNRAEVEFLGATIDALVSDVAGGSYTYLCGTTVYELLIRRLQAVMTADGKSDQKKAWRAVRAYMGPVQGEPGVYMQPELWEAAARRASQSEDKAGGGQQ